MQTFSWNFAKMNNVKKAKSIKVVAATINCAKKLINYLLWELNIWSFILSYWGFLFLNFNKCLMKRIWFLYLSFQVSVRPEIIRIIFFAKFPHYYYWNFYAKFSHFLFCENFEEQIEAEFCERTKCKNIAKFSAIRIFFAGIRI